MKKVFGYSLLILIIFNSFNLIFAQGLLPPPSSTAGQTNAEVWFGGLAKFIKSIFEGGISPLNIDYTTRILMGILLWMILYSVVSGVGLFKDMKPKFFWTGGIALILTILSFLFLPKEFVTAIATPYSAVGATILTFIPFIIIIYFTVWVTDSAVLARAIWIVFIVYYLSILLYTIFTQHAAQGPWYQTFITPTTTPYWIMLVIGIFIFLFLAQVRHWVFESKIEAAEEKGGRLVKKAGAGARILAGAEEEFSK